MTDPRAEAFASTIAELGKQRGIPESKTWYAVKTARAGFHSTAWNEAIVAGIPADELRSAKLLIYG